MFLIKNETSQKCIQQQIVFSCLCLLSCIFLSPLIIPLLQEIIIPPDLKEMYVYMYVQTFSVVVSQVKPGSQGPHSVLQFFLEVPKGSLTSVHKPVCWFCLHMVTSQFPFAPASCVSAWKLGEVNRNQMSKSMPRGAISRCLQSVHFLKKLCPVFWGLFTDRCRPGPAGNSVALLHQPHCLACQELIPGWQLALQVWAQHHVQGVAQQCEGCGLHTQGVLAGLPAGAGRA